MKALFIFCEGKHDANFIGRLLKASGKYTEYDKKISEYPGNLKKYIIKKHADAGVDLEKNRINRIPYPIVPVSALHNETGDFLVLPISLEGTKPEVGLKLLKNIRNSFSLHAAETDRAKSSDTPNIIGFSFLFIFDADSRGLQETINLFKKDYGDFSKDIANINHASWIILGETRLAVFVFTDHNGNTGTLEDIIVPIFSEKNKKLTDDAEIIVEHHFQKINPGGDMIAHNAKKKKAQITICGQQEKEIVGSALSVVLRDSVLLDNAFDFNNTHTQWFKLLNLVDHAFS